MNVKHEIGQERGKEIKVLYLNLLALMRDLQARLSLLFTFSNPCKRLIWLYALLANSSQTDERISRRRCYPNIYDLSAILTGSKIQ